jgi:NADH:ubiquinone oxidoreductase subunit K
MKYIYVNMLNTYNLNLVARKKTSKLIQGYMVLIQIIILKNNNGEGYGGLSIQ